MRRRIFLAMGISAALAAVAPAWADGTESVIRQLQDQGYGTIRVSRTLLGRVRIRAERDSERREIILNRGSGEILRDFSTDERQTSVRDDGDDDDRAGSGGRRGDDRDDDDRDDGQDDDDRQDGDRDDDDDGRDDDDDEGEDDDAEDDGDDDDDDDVDDEDDDDDDDDNDDD